MKLLLSPHLWSLRLRMIIFSLGAILAACLLLGAIAANALYSISLSVGKREAQFTAYQLASEVGQKLNFGMVAMRTLADFHSAIQPGSEISLSRKASTHMLGKILEREPMFVGVYSIWEKNQFDLLDDQLAAANPATSPTAATSSPGSATTTVTPSSKKSPSPITTSQAKATTTSSPNKNALPTSWNLTSTPSSVSKSS